MTRPLLSVRDLVVDYDSARRRGRAIDGLGFDLAEGEALALVGESGCGKSTTALALMGLLPGSAHVAGQALLSGRDLLTLPEAEFRRLRGREMGMIFQEPMTSLNPLHTIGDQIGEVLQAHTDLGRAARRARVLELLELVAIPDPQTRIDAWPHELSGGQRQRVVIAMAIALSPRLLIADEPTTALDATIQRQILELLDRLRREMGMAMILISHDLPLVSQWADRVLVMHHGQEMERLAAERLFETGRHPYTRGLISASLRLSDPRHHATARLAEIRASTTAEGEVHFDLVTPPLPAPRPPQPATPLLKVEGLSVDYGSGRRAVDDVSLHLDRGETLGLVGESGCGKSSLSRAIMRLQPIASGRITLNGRDLTALKGGALRAAREEVQMVFQDPFASLNPRQTVETMLEGVLLAHGTRDRTERSRRIAGILSQVGLPRGSGQRLPHEFSGGQRQRIGIARALILRPSLVICDEPVSALDVSVQAQILNLLSDLKEEFGLSLLFISHDLAVIRYISDRVAVMQGGRIVEENDRAAIWQAPKHPHTRQLIAASA